MNNVIDRSIECGYINSSVIVVILLSIVIIDYGSTTTVVMSVIVALLLKVVFICGRVVFTCGLRCGRANRSFFLSVEVFIVLIV